MNATYFQIAYILLGLWTFTRTTVPLASRIADVFDDSRIDAFDWTVGVIFALLTGAAWPLFVIYRIGLRVTVNYLPSATWSRVIPYIFPSELKTIEPRATKAQRRVDELRGRKSDLEAQL